MANTNCGAAFSPAASVPRHFKVMGGWVGWEMPAAGTDPLGVNNCDREEE